MGFTLIELLIVFSILSVLTMLLIFTLDPAAQINKGRDAQREADLKQLDTALDTFYNDHNCYPTSLSQLSGAGTYMKKVPDDPSSFSGWQNYAYVTDPDNPSCPQWNVIFAKVAEKIDNAAQTSTLCPLQQTSCFPGVAGGSGNPAGFNYCVLSGNVSCDYLKNLDLTSYVNSNPVPTSSDTQIPSATDTPVPTATPTPSGPVPTQCPCSTAPWQTDYSSNPPFCDGAPSGRGQYCSIDRTQNPAQCYNSCDPTK